MVEEPLVEYAVADYAAAAAELLETFAAQLRSGVSVQDIGPYVALIGRLMARRT